MHSIILGDIVVERNTESPLMIIRGKQLNDNIRGGYDPDKYVCEFNESSDLQGTKILYGHDIIVKERLNNLGQFIPIEKFNKYHRGNTGLKMFIESYMSKYPDRNNETAEEFFNDTKNYYLAVLKSIYTNPLPEAMLNAHLVIYKSTLQSWTNEDDSKAEFTS